MPKYAAVRTILFSLAFVMGASATQAQVVGMRPIPTTLVAAGCATPSMTPPRHIFYVDPVRGAANGDGSRLKPWKSLANILTQGFISTMPQWWDSEKKAWVKVRPDAPVHPGDAIRLMSGFYGNIEINGDFGQKALGFDNDEFITIEAVADQKPILGELLFNGGAKWAFRNLTFREIAPALNIRSHGYLVFFAGRVHDIIFDHNHILSISDTSKWKTQDEWVKNASSGFGIYPSGDSRKTCATVTNNEFNNVGFGMAFLRGGNYLIKSNIIDYFLHDGIDYAGDNIVIQDNILTNRIDAGDSDSIHPDFIQGQPYGAFTPGVERYSNLVFDRNILIRQTDPNMPFAKISKIAGATQGIDTFNGSWTNVRVTNNIVITTAYQGIAFFGVDGLLIANNTVLSDGGNVTQGPYSGDKNIRGQVPWISIGKTHEGFDTRDAIVRNNIVSGLVVGAEDTVVVDHNICVPSEGHCLIITNDRRGQATHNDASGVYGNHNAILRHGAASVFKDFDPTQWRFDVHLKPGSPAVGAGLADQAPDIDLAGAKRTGSTDLGVFKFQPEDRAAP